VACLAAKTIIEIKKTDGHFLAALAGGSVGEASSQGAYIELVQG
jgi:hypothetical protein